MTAVRSTKPTNVRSRRLRGSFFRRGRAATMPEQPLHLDGAQAGADQWDELRTELERSRRYRHPFVLGRIRSRPDAPALSAFLRRTDRIWMVGDALYLLLPESDRRVAEALLDRLCHDAPGVLPDDVRVAVFPLDGVTSGALLAALDGRRVDGHATPAFWLGADRRAQTGPTAAHEDGGASRD